MPSVGGRAKRVVDPVGAFIIVAVLDAILRGLGFINQK
jgi:hypothetical protein